MERKLPCQAHNLETWVRIPPPLLARSSNRLGRLVLDQEGAGSNPVRAVGSSLTGKAAVSKAAVPSSSLGFPVDARDILTLEALADVGNGSWLWPRQTRVRVPRVSLES